MIRETEFVRLSDILVKTGEKLLETALVGRLFRIHRSSLLKAENGCILELHISRVDSEDEIAEEDAHIEVSADSLAPACSAPTIVLRMEACYQDAFSVPAPFLHGWNASTGSPLSFEDLSTLLRQSASHSSDTNHAKYEFGTWMPAIHPVTSRFCATLHVCDLSRLMDPIVAEQGEALYMLAWFSLIVRHMGIALDPDAYLAWQALIKAEIVELR